MRWGLVALLVVATGCGSDDAPGGGGKDAGTDAPADVQVEAGVDAEADADVDAGEVCTTLDDSGVWLPDEGNGAFDPSVATDPGSGRVWMAYSTLNGAAGAGKVSTWLVHSDDGGATWCGAARINAAEDVAAADRPPGHQSEPSHWSHEVPALVIDPAAPATERWKLLWHRYLHAEDGDPTTDDRRFEYGWLAMRAAASPEALFSAPEQVLIAAEGYYFLSVIQSYNERFGTPKHRLADAAPELKDCLLVTEPGAVAFNASLRLWLGCGSESGIRIIALDLKGDTLTYLGAPLTSSDAQALDPALTGFNAADAFADENGQMHLLVSPIANDLYRGCLLYDVDEGNLTGPPVLVKQHTAGVPLSGACAYDPGLTAAGTLFGEIHVETPQLRLFPLRKAP
ncbi:MAG: sialidase family protein [Polyangiaceae bacterium]